MLYMYYFNNIGYVIYYESFNVYMYILACYNIIDIFGVLLIEVSLCSLNNFFLMWLVSRVLGVFFIFLFSIIKDIRCLSILRGFFFCRVVLNFFGDDELMSFRNCLGEFFRVVKFVFMILFLFIYILIDYFIFIY